MCFPYSHFYPTSSLSSNLSTHINNDRVERLAQPLTLNSLDFPLHPLLPGHSWNSITVPTKPGAGEGQREISWTCISLELSSDLHVVTSVAPTPSAQFIKRIPPLSTSSSCSVAGKPTHTSVKVPRVPCQIWWILGDISLGRDQGY